MKLHKLTCPNCNGMLEIDIKEDTEKIFCPYCGQQFYIDDQKREFTINTNIRKSNSYVKRTINDAEIIRAKTKEFEIKYAWIIPVVVILSYIIGICIWDARLDYEEKASIDKGMVKVGCSDDYIGKKYTSVVEQFEALGFENITAVDLDDAGLAFWKKDTVESISINGDFDIRSDEYFDLSYSVIITYH